MINNLGLAPGTLVYTGNVNLDKISVQLISYKDQELIEEPELSIENVKSYANTGFTNWFNVAGLNDTQAISTIGSNFGINPLLLEDIVNVNQQPKSEEIGAHLFVTLKMFHLKDEIKSIQEEHISFILGDGYLISFQEKHGDVFESVRKRIRDKHGKIRARSNDYLLYALLDAVVDNYLFVTKRLEAEIEELEDEIFNNENDEVAKTISFHRKQLHRLKRFINPTVFATQSLLKSESVLLSEQIQPFLSDLTDHAARAADRITEQRETLSGYMDLHLSLQSQKMNEIMKVLTIVAAIFIPLTFLAGIYGMNFHFMPELQFQWGYPTLLSVMLVMGITLMLYFKKKKWL